MEDLAYTDAAVVVAVAANVVAAVEAECVLELVLPATAS